MPKRTALRLVVAELGRAHGIRGEITARLYGVTPEELRELPGLTLRESSESPERPVFIESFRSKQSGWILRLDGVRDRTQAEALRGAELLAAKEVLPELDESEWRVADLEGLDVQLESGESLGRLKEVLLLPANDVIVVRGPRGEVLLPLLEDVVIHVDEEAEVMVVRPPAGLLEEEAPEVEE